MLIFPVITDDLILAVKKGDSGLQCAPRVAGVESEFVPAAEAMPEDKYSFAPTSGEFKGVRTFAQQVKHVAAVNYLVGAAILEEKPPIKLGGENGPDSIKSKAEIVKFLKESFAYAYKAVGSINDGNLLKTINSPFGEGTTTRLGMATLIVGHCFVTTARWWNTCA
jgi:hypothetical protein